MRNFILWIMLTIIASFGCEEQPTSQSIEGNGKVIHGDTITSNQVWSAARPHIIDSDLYIHHAVIEIESGAVVRFKEGASLNIMESGGLIAIGKEKQVVFTRDDGQNAWKYIFFAKNAISDSCRLINCKIEYGGGDLNWPSMIYCQEISPEMSNCVLTNSVSGGIYFAGQCSPFRFTDNRITQNAAEPVMTDAVNIPFISAGSYQGNASDYIKVVGGKISVDAEWPHFNLPYRISTDLLVTGSTLTLSSGSSLYFDANTGMKIMDGAGLIADGSEEPIIFSGFLPAKGYWNGLKFVNCAESELQDCLIEFGGADPMSPANIFIEDANPNIMNCVIKNSGQYGMIIRGEYSPMQFSNNVISSNNGPPFSTPAENLHILNRAVLSLNQENNIEVTGGEIQMSQFWNFHNVSLRIKNTVIVRGAVLHLGANLSLVFDPDASLEIIQGGGLIADGASGLISFTANSKTPGSWRCIYFGNDSNDASCLLNHCLVEFGGGDLTKPANIYCDSASPSISNCVIANSRYYGIYLAGDSNPRILNNIFNDNLSGPQYP